MANFQKVYLRIVGRVGDTSSDPDALPDRVTATGNIFLKPNVKDGWAEQTTADDGIDELMIPAPISCTIVDGWLTYDGNPFVWLVVGEENWNWNISFPQVRIAGIVRKLDAFNFDLEPATSEQIADEEYQGVNLALLQEFTDPDTGNKAVRGPRGYSVDGVSLVGGDQLVFSLDDPMNTSFPAVTIPAVTDANDARDAAIAARDAAIAAKTAAETAETNAETAETNAETAKDAAEAAANSFDLNVGTTTTLPPGSAATVNITGTAPVYSIDIGVPQGDVGPTGPPAPDATTSSKGLIQLAGVLNGTAGSPGLADNSVTTSKIADNNVTVNKLGGDVTVAMQGLIDGSASVTSKYTKPGGGIPATDLATDSVITAKIQDSAVTSAKIANGTIVDADIATAAAIQAKKTLVPASFPYVSHGGTRATGVGDMPAGLPFFENFTITQIVYFFGVADASGSTTVKLQRNRAGTTVDIVGSTQTITAANQADGTSTDAARTFTISDATGIIQSGDRILVNITAVGTTPGKLIGVWLRGYYN